MDEMDVFAGAAAAVAALVGRIEPPAWTGPGLGEWDLRALVGHASRSLVTVLEYAERPAAAHDVLTAAHYYRLIEEFATDGAAVAQRGRDAGAALGRKPGSRFAELVAMAVERAREVDPDQLITCLVGGIRFRSYLPTRTFELVVHGLDIARATRLPIELPDAALRSAARLAGEVAVEKGRGPEFLLAVTGREAFPPGFHLV